MARVEPLLPAVEIVEVAALDLHRADREADRAAVDEIPVDQSVERLDQRRAVVEAQRVRRARRSEIGRDRTRLEEARDAEAGDVAGRPFVQPGARAILDREGQAREAGGERLPEFAEPGDAAARRVAGDDRGIDRADRDAGDPVDLDRGGVQRLVHARLIGSERTAALEHERDLIRQRYRA